jgi:hypothetical protein
MKKDMLLDKYLPAYDFNEVHVVTIQASPERVFAAIKNLMPSELSPWVRWLLSLRGLPARLVGKPAQQAWADRSFLEQLYEADFISLAEEPDREVVFGMIGQFWKLIGGERPQVASPQEFLIFEHPDYAKVGANLAVIDLENGSSRCSTETRIHATNPSTRKKFAFYWRLISMGSGFIRVLWLKDIKHKAERG